MRSMYCKGLAIACLLVLVSCSNNYNQQSANEDNRSAGINNPLICCNDVPEYCLRGHAMEHILECSRLMAKYRKSTGGTIDRGCDCIAETDVIAKKPVSYTERLSYVNYDIAPQPPKKKVAQPVVKKKTEAVALAPVKKPVGQPFVQPFEPAEPTPEPVAVKQPIPTFSSIVESPKKVAYAEEKSEGCDPCKSALSPDPKCVCAACVCAK